MVLFAGKTVLSIPEHLESKFLAVRQYMYINNVLYLVYRLMVESTKVLCTLFDEIQILIPCDGPSIFRSLDKM